MQIMLKKIALVSAAAAGLWLVPVSIHVSQDAGITASIDQAQARGGRGGGGGHRGGGGGAHRGGGGGAALHSGARTSNRSANVHRNADVNRNVTRNVDRNVNRNVDRNVNRNTNVVVRPVRTWTRRPYYGTVVAGVTLGTIIAASTVPAAPADNLCWYWSNSSHSKGYWDYCTQ